MLTPKTAKPPPNFVQQPMSSILKAGLPTPRPPAALPTIKYAAAAAAAVAPPPAPSQVSPQPTAPSTASSNLPAVPPAPSIPQSNSAASTSSPDESSSSPSLTHASVTSPMLSSASVSHQPDGSFYSGQESPALSDAIPVSVPAAMSPQRVPATRKGCFCSNLHFPPGLTHSQIQYLLYRVQFHNLRVLQYVSPCLLPCASL